jgi:hypothetical protein
VHKDRWEKEVKTLFDGEVANGEALFAIANYVQPHEGDLIFDPLTNFIMEIKFVDHDAEFFQLGKNYMYHLSCEAFNYQNEGISTGVDAIDLFENNNRDMMNFQMMLEDGNALLQENTKYIFVETSNTLIRPFETNLSTELPKIDFTITNPFNY